MLRRISGHSSRHSWLTAGAVCGAVALACGEGTQATAPIEDQLPDAAFSCTHVIGYSQTAGWYHSGFESVVNDDAWQLIWRSGGAIDLWTDPDFDGWSRPVESPCAQRSATPDRVLLTISADFHDDSAWWATNISTVVSHIGDKYPSATLILLQPVVGGPSHQVCPGSGQRASTNHPVIDEGIAQITGGSVQAGFSPEVRACDDYSDFIGHLTADGYAAAAASIGQAYTPD